MNQLKTLYIPHTSDDLNVAEGAEIQRAIGRRGPYTKFDRTQPAAPQFVGVDAIVDFGGVITPEQIDLAADAGVRFIQEQTNGLDHVEVDRILNAGIMLAHCPGHLSSVALAESAMMFILMLAHVYKQGALNFKMGKWYLPMPMELAGRSLGIIGFGNSGQELARRAKAFDMRVHAVDVAPIDRAVLDEIQPDFLGSAADTDRVIAECDFISPHLHLTAETRHTIDARRIGLMKPTACIINVARGALIDEAALYDALLNGRIAGAGLDVFAAEPPDPTLPVYQLPNVCISPHNAGGSDGTCRKRAQFAAENLDRFERGEPVVAQVTR
ncbi:MAG: hypothetical protein CMJ49_07805 [Planctomycetaceae bacterium]|nr:hypothetical protein [Planctomycetaceae bacterium]